MQADEAEAHLRHLDRDLDTGRAQIEAVADRVRPRVDHLATMKVPRGPASRRIVHSSDPGGEASVELLRKRVQEVEAPQPALNMGDGHAEQPAHRRPQHGRHRVAVHEDERPGAARPHPRTELGTTEAEVRSDAREPARDIAVRPEIAATGAVSEPDVGLRQLEEVEQGRDLRHLLPCCRGDVGPGALADPHEERRELDQLPRRPVDDQDHDSPFRRACSTMSAPRHMPAPCARR